MASTSPPPPPPPPVRYSFAPSILALSIALPVIDTVVVVLRFVARRKQKAHQGLDDWLNFGALLFTWACAITIYVGVDERALGYPTPQASSPPAAYPSLADEALSNTSKVEWVHGLMGIIALGFVKLSFLFFLRRIFNDLFPKSYQTFSFMLWTSIVLGFAWTGTFLIAHIVQCNDHLAALWGAATDRSRYCSSTYQIALANSITDAILNGVLILLAFFMVSQIKMTLGKGMAVGFAFLFSLLALAVSIVVPVTVVQVHNTPANVDQQLYVSNLVWWAFFNNAIALLAINLPTLWPLLKDLSKRQIVEDLKVGIEALGYIAAPSMNGETPVLTLKSSSLSSEKAVEKDVRSTHGSERTLRNDSVMSEINASRRGDEHEYAIEYRALEMGLIV